MSGFIAIGKEETSLFRLKMLRIGIQAEAQGMRLTRGRPALVICKSEFGWKGSRAVILQKLEAEIIQRTAALPPRT